RKHQLAFDVAPDQTHSAGSGFHSRELSVGPSRLLVKPGELSEFHERSNPGDFGLGEMLSCADEHGSRALAELGHDEVGGNRRLLVGREALVISPDERMLRAHSSHSPNAGLALLVEDGQVPLVDDIELMPDPIALEDPE